MAFTSGIFLLFVLGSAAIYYILPLRCRWAVLLAASTAFYLCGGAWMILYLAAASGVTYGAGRIIEWIERKEEALSGTEQKERACFLRSCRRWTLIAAITAVFGLLFYLKYWSFTVRLLAGLFPMPEVRDLVLPLGISFYIFQSAGYVIDVYRKKIKAEHNPLKYLLFVSFFPQMVQGPIGRYGDLAPQLIGGNALNWENIRCGIEYGLWGYFKKLIIADRAAVAVSALFADYQAYGGAMIVSGMLLYCVQLYCDFSGGIDIARGAARIFGVELAENFRRPFFATSLADYWRRWHVTLGAWMKDYVFYPLSLSKPFTRLGRWTRRKIGGKAGKIIPTAIATFIVYFIIGVWHGANLRYIAYGLWNSVIITLSQLLSPLFKKAKAACRISDKNAVWHVFMMLRTNFLILIGRYMTRAPRLLAGFDMMRRTVCDFQAVQLTDGTFWKLGLAPADLAVALIGFAVILLVEAIQEKGVDLHRTVMKQNGWVQWACLMAMLLALLFFGLLRGDYIASEFIYQNF